MKLTAQYFKDYLLRIYKPVEDFDLVITSKTPKTRMGYYRFDKRIIVIHYVGVLELNYSHRIAIHELAHHIHYTEFEKITNGERTHGKEFYLILNALFTIAVQKELYDNSRVEHLIKHSSIR